MTLFPIPAYRQKCLFFEKNNQKQEAKSNI